VQSFACMRSLRLGNQQRCPRTKRPNEALSSNNQIASTTQAQYDLAGNQTFVNGNSVTYNGDNLVTAVTGLGISDTILYDGLGQRVQRTHNGTATTYVYDALGVAQEYVSGAWSRDYIADGTGTIVATENASAIPCKTCYFASDHLGSVRVVMDQNANVVARHDFLPFGEEIASGSAGRTAALGFNGITSDAAQKFTGQVRDQEPGMDYFNARYFTATMGRFNSPDPGNAGADLLSSQSWNGYGYVNGNPLNSTDPDGTDTISWSSPTVDVSGSSNFTFSFSSSNFNPFASGPNPFAYWGASTSRVFSSPLGPKAGLFGENMSDPLFGAPTGSCSGDLVRNIDNFLSSVLPKGNPFLNTGATMAQNGSTYHVDPRVASSILALESGNGRSYKGNKPFGIRGGRASYKSPALAIRDEFFILNLHIKTDQQTSINALYSGQSWVWADPTKPHWPNNVLSYPGYCGSDSGPTACGAGGGAVSKFLVKQGGNPISVEISMWRLMSVSVVLAFCPSFISAFGSEGSYRITSGREIVSEYYDYSFRVPRGWTIVPNAVPLLSTMSLTEIRGDELIPRGKASISFVPSPSDDRIVTIPQAIAADRRMGYPHPIATRSVVMPLAAHVANAIAVSFYSDTGDEEWPIHESNVYMDFGGRVAAFTLNYRKGDPKSAQYERDLRSILSSFGRLGGPSAPDAQCPPLR